MNTKKLFATYTQSISNLTDIKCYLIFLNTDNTNIIPYRKTYNQSFKSRDDYLCDIRSLDNNANHFIDDYLYYIRSIG